MPRLTSNYVCMSVGMLYLSCVKMRELRLFVEKLSNILCKSCKCLLLQFYLMYTAIILYLETLVGIIAYFEK